MLQEVHYIDNKNSNNHYIEILTAQKNSEKYEYKRIIYDFNNPKKSMVTGSNTPKRGLTLSEMGFVKRKQQELLTSKSPREKQNAVPSNNKIDEIYEAAAHRPLFQYTELRSKNLSLKTYRDEAGIYKKIFSDGKARKSENIDSRGVFEGEILTPHQKRWHIEIVKACNALKHRDEMNHSSRYKQERSAEGWARLNGVELSGSPTLQAQRSALSQIQKNNPHFVARGLADPRGDAGHVLREAVLEMARQNSGIEREKASDSQRPPPEVEA